MRMGLAIAGLTLLVTGCSSGDTGSESIQDQNVEPSTSGGAAPFPSGQYSERDVREHLGLVDDSGLIYYRAGGLDCEVAVVLSSPQEVSTYVDAGDVVATDPQQRVGVKLVEGLDPIDSCFDAVTAALDDFDA